MSTASDTNAMPLPRQSLFGVAQRPWLYRYLIAIAATLAVAVLRSWLDPILGTDAAFATFYLSIIFTAWFCGFGPALMTLVLGICLGSYLFDSTRGSLFVYPFREQVACTIYAIIGLYLAHLIASLTRDIARRQQLENDLRASQEASQLHLARLAHISRLSIMGEMAAGLAHELNQPLHAAKNYARGSLRRLAKNPLDDGEVARALELIASEADRAAEILRRVRDFTQKTDAHVSAIAINDLIREAVTIVSIELKRTGGRIVCELAPDLPLVKADPIQIEQVVVNLARNGLEAMNLMPEEQRLLTVGTRKCDDRTVEVFVRDRGQGLGPEEMESVFEPFFTTKPEGMGMGLAISRSIVDAHEGRIWVEAKGDRGCTFRFTLPAAQPA